MTEGMPGLAGIAAGVRILAPVAGDLPQAGFHDCTLQAVVGEPEPAGRPWRLASGDGCALLSTDGRRMQVITPPPRGDREASGRFLRSVAPFAAALQGRLTLHAACVQLESATFAFIGASGTGKSTLASCLGAQGARVLSDDLLPVRFERDLPLVPNATGGGLIALDWLLFPGREAGLDRPLPETLPPVQAMALLLRHGFGELRAPAIWRMQFAGYGRLVRRCRAARLRIPEGIARLPGVAGLLREMAGAAR